ncbi:hypothetical protein AAC387_Pa08g1644 [Persea americana]
MESMDGPSSKKLKADDNGADFAPSIQLTPEDARKIIEPLSTEQLLDILQSATLRHPDILDAVRSVADRDPAQRKLFIRGLGWETTTDVLRSHFSFFGEIDEAIVILDRATGKSKGFGFVTFKHIDGALLALKEPSKKIDGRMTVAQLAAVGSTANAPAAVDLSQRKLFVGSVPFDMPSDRLLAHFSLYGEIEEGPLGYDKQTGKSRGFALFIYRTVEAARAALVEPIKNVDGHQLVCKIAIDGKKGKLGGGVQEPSGAPANQEYGAPGGLSSYGGLGGGFSGSNQVLGLSHYNLNTPLQSSIGGIGGQGLSSVGNHAPSSLGGGNAGGFGAISGGSAGGYGPGLGGGAGLGGGSYGSLQYGAPGPTGYSGSSMYQLPQTSGGYPEGGHFGLSASAYESQNHPQAGPSLAPRAPSGGMYQGMPPYY